MSKKNISLSLCASPPPLPPAEGVKEVTGSCTRWSPEAEAAAEAAALALSWPKLLKEWLWGSLSTCGRAGPPPPPWGFEAAAAAAAAAAEDAAEVRLFELHGDNVLGEELLPSAAAAAAAATAACAGCADEEAPLFTAGESDLGEAESVSH